MTGSGWRCYLVLDKIVLEDLYDKGHWAEALKDKRTSQVIILGNNTRAKQEQLPRVWGGKGLVCSRNGKSINISRAGGRSRKSGRTYSQRGNEGETTLVLKGCGKDIIPSYLSIWKVLRGFDLYVFVFILIFIFTLFYFTILYWFCHILTWIHHRCTWVPKHELPSHLPSHIISLDHPCAPAPSILYPASNIDWRFVSYMIVYMFQCHSPKSSHPLPLP